MAHVLPHIFNAILYVLGVVLPILCLFFFLSAQRYRTGQYRSGQV